MSKLTDIETIGEVYSSKLEQAGVSSIESLLEAGCDAKGRKALADATGISTKLILNWVNRADLARINGISTQYADLLEVAGVDTVPELAMRNAENLQVKMAELNDEKHLVRKVPVLAQVEDWIAQAGQLDRKVHY